MPQSGRQLLPKGIPPDASHPATLVVVGRVGAPYGVRGWSHIHSYTHPVDNLLNYRTWHLQQGSVWLARDLASGRRHAQGIVAQLEGVTDRDEARLLTGALVALDRALLPPLREHEFYWADLEGSVVQTAQGIQLGVVASLYQNAGVDVMIVEGERERHVPFVFRDTVLHVDLAQKAITVDWDPAI